MSFSDINDIIETSYYEVDILVKDMDKVDLIKLMCIDSGSTLFGYIDEDVVVIEKRDFSAFNTYFDAWHIEGDRIEFNDYVIMSNKSEMISCIISRHFSLK
jgi:hypothetical protein